MCNINERIKISFRKSLSLLQNFLLVYKGIVSHKLNLICLILGVAIPRIEPDDDALSLSVRSVASSCSLASEVYERARKRTQEFWGKDGIASR